MHARQLHEIQNSIQIFNYSFKNFKLAEVFVWYGGYFKISGQETLTLFAPKLLGSI